MLGKEKRLNLSSRRRKECRTTLIGIVFQQLLTMFSIMFFGFLLIRSNVINSEGTRQISTILSLFVMPATMITSFNADFDAKRLKLLLWATLAAFLTISIRAAIVQVLLKKEDRIDKYATIFPNAGFVGIPLVLATVGYEGVFFMSGYIMANNVTQWTYGQYLISGDKKAMTLRQTILNPGMIGAAIGLCIYISRLPVPEFLWKSVDSLAALNTPLAMIILGSYIANSNFSELLAFPKAYWTTFLRLIVTALISIGIIYLLPIDDYMVEIVLTIASCAPAATNTAILGRLFGGDYEYGARLVVLTTLLSLFTIPIIVQFAQVLFG